MSAGLLSSAHRAPLSELFDDNPLLFDFVLKRALCLGGDPARGFSSAVFRPGSGPFASVV